MKQEKRTLRQRIHDFYYTKPKPEPTVEEQLVSLRRLRRASAIVLAVALILAVALTVTALTLKHRAAPAYRPDAVVLSADGYTLTNLEFGYYFWSEYVHLLFSSTALPFDTSQPLDEQWYDDNTTWQEHLTGQAMDTARQTAALSADAKAHGFTLPQDYQQSLDEQLDAYRKRAAEDGFATVDEFLASLYGEGATEQTFTQYLQDSFLASAYSDELYASFSFTDQQISNYYDQYADQYQQELGIAKDDSYPCDLRCIFLTPETDDEDGWNAAKALADKLFAQWQEEPTQDSFAALAEEYNQDTLGGSGGLYAAVTKGKAEAAIDDWCFDPARQSGDATVLKFTSGYVLVYYVAQSDAPTWKLSAEADLRYEAYQNRIATLVDAFGFTVHPDAIVTVMPESLTAEGEASR